MDNVFCSIDRLTVLADSEEWASIQIKEKIWQYLERKLVNDFKLKLVEYEGGASFGVAWHEFDEYGDETEENLVFIHVFRHANQEECRIDFNPNSLIKHDVEYLWGFIKSVLIMLRVDLRLSRFDLAFDIINAPYVVGMKNVKGGVTRKELYGRKGDLETVYWGSQASTVQVRLYNKLVEQGGDVSNIYKIVPELREMGDFGYKVQVKDAWRLEMQLRTKAINEQMVFEVVSRLSNFTLTSAYDLDLEPKLRRFADMFLNTPQYVNVAYPDVSERTIRRWKAKVRKAVEEGNDNHIEDIKKALQRDSEKLGLELKKYCDEFLGF